MGNFVRTLEHRQGLQTGSPDEIVFENSWTGEKRLRARAEKCAKNDYGDYLLCLLKG